MHEDQEPPQRIAHSYKKTLYELLGVFYNHIKDKNIRYHMDLLCTALADSQTETKRGVKGKQGDTEKMFLAIFMDKYLKGADMAYDAPVSAKDIKMIKDLIKKLKSHDLHFKDYITWLFDDFLQEPSAFKYWPPSIRWSCADWLVKKFIFLHKNRAVLNRAKENRENKTKTVLSHAKSLYKKTGDEKISRLIEQYEESMISLKDFEQKLV